MRKAGSDLRITAQLIQVDDGSHLWSQSYDRKLENVFAIQSEIAASIAQALKINLIGAGQSSPVAQVAASLPAYELFLQARRLIQGRTRSGLEAARGLLEEALKLDPNYAPALAALAQTLLHLQNTIAGYGGIPLDQARAKAQPLLALGRNEEAVAAARERFAAAPEDRDAAEDLLTTLSSAGRFDAVLALYRERWSDIKALDADVGPVASEAIAVIAAAQRATGDKNGLAETLALWHKRMDFLREQGYVSGAFRMTEASYFTLSGERASALKALTQAIDLGVRDPLLARDPAFAWLRDDPEFKAQNARMTQLINIERAKLGMAALQ